MGRYPLSPEYMPVSEWAGYMGHGCDWAYAELKRDSKRDVPRYPFAVTTQDPLTGRWSYRIHRRRFERWNNGDDLTAQFDYELLAGLVSQQIKAK